MKIAFVIYGLGSGGAERSVTGLANYFVDQNQVSIITLVKTTPFFELDPKVRLHYCLEQPKERTNPVQSIKDGMLRIRKLVKLLKTIEAEVVISFMYTSNIYTILAAKWVGIPSIGCERSNHAVFRLPRIQEHLRKFSYQYLSKLVVQTQGNQKYYEGIMPARKITIIPNAVSESLQPQRQLPQNLEEKIILNVGSFKNGKAQDLLIRAFAQINNPAWRLVFIGQGPNLEKFKVLANKLAVGDQIDFLGTQKDIATYYNKASLFVFTSEHEGFPNALLEALYFGLPCISTNCPHGPADLIEDGLNGFLVPVGNQEALQEKMTHLMKNKNLGHSFSKMAVAKSKTYEIEQIAEQWMDVLKSVTN
ncbi:MAG: glycosyltransferase family 4 protein [Flavobacteriales bacterium]